MPTPANFGAPPPPGAARGERERASERAGRPLFHDIHTMRSVAVLTGCCVASASSFAVAPPSAALALVAGLTPTPAPPASAAAARFQSFNAGCCAPQRQSLRQLRMMADLEEIDGTGGTTDGGTFFATLDGRDEEGISPDGMVPPGEDLIESDLRRLFDLESEDGLSDGSDMDELKVRQTTSPRPSPASVSSSGGAARLLWQMASARRTRPAVIC